MSRIEIDHDQLRIEGFDILRASDDMPGGSSQEDVHERLDWMLYRMAQVQPELVGEEPEHPTSYRLAPSAQEGRGLIAPHVEGVYSPIPLQTFALGAVSAALEGGETFVMHGGRLAERIQETVHVPEGFEVQYGSWGGVTSDEEPTRHRLFVDRKGSLMLMFAHRNAASNQAPIPDTPENRQVLQQVEEIVEQAVNDPAITTDVALQPGEILIVDNNSPHLTTLHHRRLFEEAFPGQRLVIRERFNDPMANTYRDPWATNLELFRAEAHDHVNSVWQS